jgi:hypothetical protein
MNWKRIHDKIIKRAQNRTLDGYSELHHILPKCLGGTNDETNLVRLTAREHFIIHKILNILHPEVEGLRYAVWIFVTFNDNRGIRIGSKEYERLRKLFAESASNRMKINNPSFNVFTKEHRKKISKAGFKRFKDPNERKKANSFRNLTDEERKERIKVWSNAAMGPKNGRFKWNIMVNKIDKISGEIINVYEYPRLVQNDGFNPKYVINCCNKKSKSHGGFLWEWREG